MVLAVRLDLLETSVACLITLLVLVVALAGLGLHRVKTAALVAAAAALAQPQATTLEYKEILAEQDLARLVHLRGAAAAGRIYLDLLVSMLLVARAVMGARAASQGL